jgi:hypothetical protein
VAGVVRALYRLGRYDAAAVEITAAEANGAGDARLLFHKGAIEVAQGRTDLGRADLQRALALGPAIDPNERTEATLLLKQ